MYLNYLENPPKSNFIKKVDGRLIESIRNIEIQNYLCSRNFKTQKDDNSNNKNTNRESDLSKIYKSAFIDLSDKRNIFKSMYGEFWNIKNFETYPGKRKKKPQKIEFNDEKLLIKKILSKLKIKNLKKIFQSKSNSHFYSYKNEYFNETNRTNFNKTNYKNSYVFNNFNNNLTIPNNKKKLFILKKNNKNDKIINKFKNIEFSKNNIKNHLENKEDFDKLASLMIKI